MLFKQSSEGVLVHKIACVGEWLDIDPPKLSTEVQCYTCGCRDHYSPGISNSRDSKKVWICANPLCLTTKRESCISTTTIPVDTKRALEWSSACEIWGLGDKSHDISFEKIEQSQAKINFMREFVAKPSGIILMMGNRGGGKTYASLGMLEMFTRKSSSCKFMKIKDLFDEWQRWNKQDSYNDLLNRLVNVSFLVLDDFAIREPSPAFMEFFLQLLDKRFDWKGRGTIITTNLDEENLSRICGETLMDRLKCAQIFVFEEGSRRKYKPL